MPLGNDVLPIARFFRTAPKISCGACRPRPLLVQNVVVFKEVLAHVEVRAFHFFLRLCDGLRDEAELDRLVFRKSNRSIMPLSDRRRKCAKDRRRATGKIATNRGRPAGPRGRAAGCRCAARRGVRCRSRASRQVARPFPLPPGRADCRRAECPRRGRRRSSRP